MADRDWLLVLLGAIGFIVISHQIPILRQLNTSETMRLEDIEGIDINSLNILRQRQLM